MFVVMCNVWTSDGYDYLDAEYSGTRHATYEEAVAEMKHARALNDYDFYIIEV